VTDVRCAVRALRRIPWLSATVIGLTAAWIALATTVFAVVDGVLPETADELYRHREDPASARRAAELWQIGADRGEFEAAWKLARVCYWIGTHERPMERRQWLERGIAAGQAAIKLETGKPEGHFWMAADMGALVQLLGISNGIRYGSKVRRELEATIGLAPGWQGGSAECALGRWFESAPWVFGGSDKKAEEMYRSALAINPESRNALLSLANLLIRRKGLEEAKVLLRRVIDAPEDAEWIPEDRELVAQAGVALKRLGGSRPVARTLGAVTLPDR
jgi:tetratricopeptide (TPR) repeat protein